MQTEFSRDKQSGFTLIELMIALVLGLLVVGAASALFLSNRRTYGTTTAVNRIQENGRAAFEFMSRDLRAAGSNPCSANVINMLVNRATPQWAAWNLGMSGTEGGSATAPDSVTVHYTDRIADPANPGRSDLLVTLHADPVNPIQVSSTGGIAVGDVLMVCNPQEAVIFAVTGVQTSPIAIKHDVGTTSNAMTAFQISQSAVITGSAPGTVGYCFTKPAAPPANPNCLDVGDGPAVIVRPISVNWSIAANNNNGTSLYRTVSSNGVQISRDEIAAGVTNMQLTYQTSGRTDFRTATAIDPLWDQVDAVKLVLTLQPEAGALSTNDRNGTGGQRLTRTVSSTIAIRNRKDIRG